MPCSNRCIPLTGIAKCALAAGLCGAPCHRHLTFVIHTSSCGVCGGCCAASCCNCHGKPAAASAAAFVAATVFVAATAFTAPRCCPRGDLGGSGGFRWWAETLEVAVSDEGLLGRLLLPLLVLPPEEGADEAEAGVPEVEEDAGRSSGTPLAPPPSRLHGARPARRQEHRPVRSLSFAPAVLLAEHTFMPRSAPCYLRTLSWAARLESPNCTQPHQYIGRPLG